MNALDVTFGAVTGVVLALAGWAAVVLLTTRPASMLATAISDRDEMGL